jgi:amino acid adenylation domain-containing protein
MRVEEFLRASARRSPGKTALVAGKLRPTFKDVDIASDRLAATFLAKGVKRGDRVVIFMDNCVEAVVAIFATLKTGAVFSPVNASTKAEKLAYILNNCGAAALVTQHKLIGAAADALAEAASVKLTVVAGGQEAPTLPNAIHWREAQAAERKLPVAGIDSDLAMIIYTSGSTGFPKGVMMTHANIEAAATSITTYLENTSDDVIMNVLPISFDYGLYQVLMAMKLGATLVLEKSFVFPQAVFDKLRAERVTGFPIVPTMAALILQMRDLKPGAFPDLRYITNTAAALPPAHIQRLQELFPGVRLYSMYGQTECKRCTWLPPAELSRRPGSVGIAIPNTEAYVVDDGGRQVEAGAVGELVIRGPHVMKGYWQDQAATDRALKPGSHPWERVLHTGDLFRTDEEGFLYFVGRKDDIIKSRGEKVSPKEVENVLYALPGVREAAVVGVPDPVLGHAIKAVVALEPDAIVTRDDVIRHCAKHLEDFMIPKAIEFRTELPKSENGKIDRREIARAEMSAAT